MSARGTPSVPVEATTGRKWTRATVAAAIRRWYEEEGRAPTADDWRTKARDWTPTHSVVTNLFGSWPAARYAARVPDPPRRARRHPLTRAEIAAELRALADRVEARS